MAKMKFFVTILSKLNLIEVEKENLIVCRDNCSLYIDINDNERIEIKEWIDVDTENERISLFSPIPSKIYYTKDTNRVWKYINSNWVCLNNASNINKSDIIGLLGFAPADAAEVNGHINNSTIHVTSSEKSVWNGKQEAIKHATNNTTLVDADTIPLSDSAANYDTKKITFVKLKEVLKAYFDTLYDKTTIDSVLSTTSTNPVQNKVVKGALDDLSNGKYAKPSTGIPMSDLSALAANRTIKTNASGILATDDQMYTNYLLSRVNWTDNHRFVILLHPAYDGTTLNKSFCNGKFDLIRGGTAESNRFLTINVVTQSAYNTMGYEMMVNGFSSTTTERYVFRFCTCLYNGKKYLAIYGSSNSVYSYFTGKFNNAYPSDFSDALKVIAYFDNLGAKVLNQEIYNSVSYLDDSLPPQLNNGVSLLTTSNVDTALSTTSTNPVQNKVLQKALADMSTSSAFTFVYTCTGINDDLALQNLINNFFINGITKTMKLIITGAMGLSDAPADNVYIHINVANPRNAECYLDFSDCSIPVGAAGKIFLRVNNAAISMTIDGLVVTAYTAVRVDNVKRINFNNCVFTNNTNSESAVYLIYGTNNFINCRIEGTGTYSYAVNVYGSSTNNFVNCHIIGAGTYSYAVNIYNGQVNNFVDCHIVGYYAVQMNTTGYNNFTNCRIVGSTEYAVYLTTGFSMYASFVNCRIIGNTTGIIVSTANVSAEIKLIGCLIKGTGTQDIQQTTAASTIKWYIMGNSFSRASVIVDGTAAISSKAASAHIYFPQYANQFSRTIT